MTIEHREDCLCPDCRLTFLDQLASLCGPEIAAAMRESNPDRAADMITALATMLGRTIARACKGDPRGIETMMTGAEELIAEEASDMANFIAAASAAGFRQ